LSQSIYCDKCLKEIKVRGDLVIATSFFEVFPYHEDCYAKNIKGAATVLLNNQPLNGFSGNFLAIVGFILLIVSLFVKDDLMILVSIISTIPIIYRAYSYFVFERHLEK
jgi:hypothetical protein